MKKICFLILLLASIVLHAQTAKDTSSPYQKNPAIPPIKIIQSISGTDTAWFTNSNLPKNKSIVIIYFSPDCSHCQYEAKEIVKQKDSLQNAFFVWVTYNPIEDMHAFYEKYGLNKMQNIAIGRDPKYFIPAFFRVEFTPYMAIYKNGKFSTEFREGAKPEELAAAVN